MGIRLRRSDPRIRKPPRRVRVWTFDQMRQFASGERAEIRARTPRPADPRNRRRYKQRQRFYPPHDYEALILMPALTGLRLGEFLALRRADFIDGAISLAASAHEGQLVGSSDQKNHERVVPIPPSLALLLEALPERADTDLLFPTPRGRLWRERNFYREGLGAGQDCHGPRADPARVSPLLCDPPTCGGHRRCRSRQGRWPPG